MIEKLLNEKTDTFNSMQALVSLVCESTSDKGKAIIHDKVTPHAEHIHYSVIINTFYVIKTMSKFV